MMTIDEVAKAILMGYVAANKDGSLFWYRLKPTCDLQKGIWKGQEPIEEGDVRPLEIWFNYKEVSQNWETSLHICG